jgi:hypothetical protein
MEEPLEKHLSPNRPRLDEAGVEGFDVDLKMS